MFFLLVGVCTGYSFYQPHTFPQFLLILLVSAWKPSLDIKSGLGVPACVMCHTFWNNLLIFGGGGVSLTLSSLPQDNIKSIITGHYVFFTYQTPQSLVKYLAHYSILIRSSDTLEAAVML